MISTILNKTWLRLFLVLAAMLPVTMTSCSCGGGRGVEVGNPAFVGKQVVIVPADGSESYLATFATSEAVVVSKQSTAAAASLRAASRAKISAAIVETTTVAYSTLGNTVTFSVTFSDGTEISVEITFDDDGNVISGTLTVNGETVSAEFETNEASHAGSTDDAFAAGLAAFEAQDLATAEDEYCGELADNPANSSLAFGCFWAKLLLLPESDEAAAVLGDFGQDTFDTETDLLGADGLFGSLDDLTAGNHFPLFNYSSFSSLPFASYFASASGTLLAKFGGLLQLAIDNEVDVADIQSRLDDMIPLYAELEAYLAVVVADTDFSFTLPGELFLLDADVPVTRNDATLFISGIEAAIVGLNWANAYDAGVTISDIVVSGVIDPEILAADLGGTGETVNGVEVDTVVFLTLLDAERITETQSRFEASLAFASSGLSVLAGGETSAFYDAAAEGYDLNRGVAFIDALLSSVGDGMTALPGVNNLSVDMGAFFATPPDAANLDSGAGDPFVFEDDKATPVESYFNELLNGIAEFDF